MFHDNKRTLCFHIFAEPQLHVSLESGMKSLNQEFPTSSNFNFRIKDIDYPEEFGSSEGWKKMFKPCSTQRLFIPLVMRDVPHLVYTAGLKNQVEKVTQN
jgi:UDP-xylose:glucoside alpha-1,3-xylosyltransferase